MSLEATVVVVDNSEWTRNGDYAPSRFTAQQDAVNLLAGAKTQANPESTVGVLTMAGKTPRILVTPTPDLGKVLNSMASLEIEGEANFAAAVQIAQLALKHRQNKNQRQRIVIFVGSPLSETKEQLAKIAKKLKKNNVAVDVVSFGNQEDNAEKLQAFIETVNSSDNSHLVAVPAGTILSDQLFGSPIYQQDGGAGYAAGGGGEAAEAGGGGGGAYEFGVDPNLDPELALALRVSLEEERARQTATEGVAGEGQPAEGAAAGQGAAAAAGGPGGEEPMDEDALLQQALAMSMDVDVPPSDVPTSSAPAQGATAAADDKPADAAATPAPASAAPTQPAMDAEMMEGIDDPELAAALAMSMSDFQSEPAATPAPAASSAAATSSAPAAPVKPEQPPSSNLLGDADYMRSVLASLPGVDPNDPALQNTLRELQGGNGDSSQTHQEADAKKEDGQQGGADKSS